MADIRNEIQVLVSVAKIDADLARFRSELSTIPSRIAKIAQALHSIEKSEKEARQNLEEMRKERRKLETRLEDDTELLKKYKMQLMEVKTNKEYSAMLAEIAGMERKIDDTEERLLILMDQIEEQESTTKEFSENTAEEREGYLREKAELEEREKLLKEQMENLSKRKPALLKALNDQVRKRYDRLLAKLGDRAITNVIDEVCQGCFSRIPPQTANEVKQNDRIITCEVCGRILVHY